MATTIRTRPTLLAALLVAFAPSMAPAHPHVFIDAGLRLVVEAGRVTAVEVTWTYDELYTLLLTEDYGLDPDFDLVLSAEEEAAMLGFDLNWEDGFAGGLELWRGAAPMAIGAPEPVSVTMIGEGQIVSVHRRPVTDPGGEGALVASAYDPEFYAAMEMTGEMSVEGAACEARLERADLDAAYAALETAIEEIGGAVASEDNFPQVGALFADLVVFECAG